MTFFFCKECEKSLESDKYYRKLKIFCKDCLNKEIKGQYSENLYCKEWLAKHNCEKNEL